MLQGVPSVDSSTLDARQQEKTRFGVVAYQASPSASFDYQVAFFNRWTDLHYQPDPVGDLVFNGVAATITRRNSAGGVQADSSYRLGDSHILRAGLFAATRDLHRRQRCRPSSRPTRTATRPATCRSASPTAR